MIAILALLGLTGCAMILYALADLWRELRRPTFGDWPR